MSSLSTRIGVEGLRSLAFGSISSTYTALGSAYLNPVIIYHLQNLTDVNLVYSWDGVNDHGVIASGAFILIDVTANRSVANQLNIAKGMITYIRSFSGSSPTTGPVYLTVFYGQ